MNLKSPLEEFPGVGQVRCNSLARLGLSTAEDLLRHFPRDYEDRTKLSTIAAAEEGENVCILAMVAETPRLQRIRKGLDVTKVKVVDDASSMTVTFTASQSERRSSRRPSFLARAGRISVKV